MMEHSSQAQAPYPPIRPAEENPLYARFMLSNMGGRDSEISAVTSYFYFHLVAEEDEIARAFHRISVAEMRHLEIFGQLALALGADPRLWQRGGRGWHYWSPGYLEYPRKTHAILQAALKGELGGIEKYKSQLRRVKDENIAAHLRRIIQDEEEHVTALRELIARYG